VFWSSLADVAGVELENSLFKQSIVWVVGTSLDASFVAPHALDQRSCACCVMRSRAGMEWVMLTVMSANAEAFALYTTLVRLASCPSQLHHLLRLHCWALQHCSSCKAARVTPLPFSQAACIVKCSDEPSACLVRFPILSMFMIGSAPPIVTLRRRGTPWMTPPPVPATQWMTLATRSCRSSFRSGNLQQHQQRLHQQSLQRQQRRQSL
jgi:hypothetical protein